MDLRTAAALSLLCSLVLFGCPKPQSAEHPVALVLPTVVAKPPDCTAVDIAMSSAELRRQHDGTAIPAELQAADYWCRNQRIAQTTSSEQNIPVVAAMNDTTYFGLLRRKDVEDATSSCHEISKVVGLLLAKSNPPAGAMVLALNAGACANLREEILHDNPLVVLSGTVVVAHGAFESFTEMTEDKVPGLEKTMALLSDLNNRFDAALREAAQQPVYWVRDHPEEALAALNALTAPLAIEQVKEFAQTGVQRILETGSDAGKVKTAAKLLGGPVAEVTLELLPNDISPAPGPGAPPIDPCIVNPALCPGKEALEALGVRF